MLHEDRGRAESFGAEARRYDRARPRYPDALAEHLLRGGVHDVLDVGCGTGIVGRMFASRGVCVLGIEPDERMAAVARDHGLDVEISTFERWRARGRRFDLVVSGQAWHWVDPHAGAHKALQVLAPGGRIALFWNFGTPPAPLHEELAAIYARLEPRVERYSVLLGNADSRLIDVRGALRGTGRFTTPRLRTWTWTQQYTTEQWLEQLHTHSDHHALPARRRKALLDEVARAVDRHGGRLQMTYDTHLLGARLR